ncbi:hypothetical protein [Roseobacter sp.]|uniref:hypothetical protein n=1 Tax=Roseobacter sp. TaxID=1907202 RepID=UPI00385BFE60
MAELTQQSKPQGDVRSDDVMTSSGIALPKADWEERLAAARAKREKLLEAKTKAKAKDKPKPIRPQFFDEDDGFDLILSKPLKSFDPKPAKPAIPPEPQKTKIIPVVEIPTREITVEKKSVETAPPVVAPAKLPNASSPRIATVAFASFFGLGCGMVLSFGVVVAMGWIPLRDAPPQQAAPRAAQGPSKAPSTFFDPDLKLSPQPVGGNETIVQLAQLNPVVLDVRDAPGLVAASAADIPPRSVLSPGPEVDVESGSSKLFAHYDLQLEATPVAFENPGRFNFAPSVSVLQYPSNDAMPALPERSAFNIQTVLSVPDQPLVDSIQLTVAYKPETVPVRMSMPGGLFENVTHDASHAGFAAPEPLSVFYSDLSLWSPQELPDATVFVVARAEDVTPDQKPSPRASLPETSGARLPAVEGPPTQTSNLASILGLGPGAANRFGLVTFAPTSVTADQIESNTQTLASTGLPVASVNRVNFKVSKTHVRYYNRQDEEVAQAVAAEVGGVARDFTTAANAPPPGRVEVWLAGSGNPSGTVSKPARSSNRNTNSTTEQTALKERLQNNLVKSLRRGKHLGELSR